MFNPLLTAFVCVADCGSFNKAAERLYISPPSVMKQINALEKHLDIKLFDRSNQGIRLTAAGQVIYRHARFMFDYSAKAIEEAKQQEQIAATTFCIGSSLHLLTRAHKTQLKSAEWKNPQIFHSICTYSLVALICVIRPSTTFLLSSKLIFSQL